MRSTTMHANGFTLARFLTALVIVLPAIFPLAGSLTAAPPHPDLLERQRSVGDDGVQTQIQIMIPDLEEMHNRGICTPDDPYFKNFIAAKASGSLAPTATDFRLLALLVDFSDHPASVAPAFFDTLIFGTGTGTIADYLDEVSYGELTLSTNHLPSSIGWIRAPQTYAYYVNNQQGLGGYPQNSQGLVTDLINAVDAQVNFAPYDNDNNGYVDVLLVIHTGTGAELSGAQTDIWSHKWGISPNLRDGVYVSSFTVQPEFWNTPGDMTIGVYAHELCHGFGLPDLYDTDYSSKGVGAWCLMSFGSWNGSLGSSPSHPCAWSRIEMGFAAPQVVQQNLLQEPISAVESTADIYMLELTNSEYFLVENRQRTGYDAGLPSSGLLIWHIDDSKGGNTQEWYPGQPTSNHYLVALEQSDGDWDLEHNVGYGDNADPFPGSTNNTDFDTSSTPASTAYATDTLFVGVTNISGSAATMYADLTPDSTKLVLGYDDPDPVLPVTFELDQNYPNPFNPSTTIEFDIDRAADVTLTVYNTLGQRVTTLINERLDAGHNEVIWDAKDSDGEEVASGVYFYRLAVGDQSDTRKMMLVR